MVQIPWKRSACVTGWVSLGMHGTFITTIIRIWFIIVSWTFLHTRKSISLFIFKKEQWYTTCRFTRLFIRLKNIAIPTFAPTKNYANLPSNIFYFLWNFCLVHMCPIFSGLYTLYIGPIRWLCKQFFTSFLKKFNRCKKMFGAIYQYSQY